jgi:hypothetical protein
LVEGGGALVQNPCRELISREGYRPRLARHLADIVGFFKFVAAREKLRSGSPERGQKRREKGGNAA